MNEMTAGVLLWIGVSVWLAYRRSRLPLLSTFSCLFLIGAQFILVEQAIFGVPARLLAFALAVLTLSVDVATNRGRLSLSRPAQGYFWLWLGYMAAIFVSSLANGTITGAEAFLDYFGRYGFALVAFLMAYRLASHDGGGRVLTGFLFFIALANFLAALAQVGGYQQAYDLHDLLFPNTREKEVDLQESGLITTFGYAPGLSSYSISTGYILACFGLAGIGYASAFSRTIKLIILSLTLLVVSLGGALILSRSTMISGVLCYLICLFILMPKNTRVLFLATVVAISAIILGVGIGFSEFQDLIPGISRVTTLEDTQRADMWRKGIVVAMDYPIFGGFTKALESGALDIGAHNFILNGFLYFGVFGFIPMLAVVAYPIYWGLMLIRMGMVKCFLVNPFAVAALGGAIAYLIKSMAHNESIVTSGIQYCVLVGAVFGGISLSSNSRQKNV